MLPLEYLPALAESMTEFSDVCLLNRDERTNRMSGRDRSRFTENAEHRFHPRHSGQAATS